MKHISFIIGCIAISYSLSAQQPDSYFKGGHLYVVYSSHQDIAWMDAPEECVRFRDEKMITPVLDFLKKNKGYAYSIESAMYLHEYLNRHPERYAEILQYVREGRLEFGATYQQPYQGMYDGEALVRQTYLGRKMLLNDLPGYNPLTAFNEDVPAMSLQFPQILAKSGIPYLQLSRFKRGMYRWYSPDGSSIMAWTPGHYQLGTGLMEVYHAKNDQARTERFKDYMNIWDSLYRACQLPHALMYLFSEDNATPPDWSKYMADWNKSVENGNPQGLPYISSATATTAMQAMTANSSAKVPEIHGERPGMWLYIHGPTHQKAVTAAREASRLLTAAEKFAGFQAMVTNSFSDYPTETLNKAWKEAIYADHGWGGNHGAITDRMFREKFEYARDKGREMLDHAMTTIAERINLQSKYARAVTVFNPLSWERTDPVTFTLDTEGADNNHLRLVDANGNDVAYQLTTEHNYKGNHDEVLTFVFLAEKVPALGYKTYYLTEGTPPAGNEMPSFTPVYENKYYKAVLGKGGIESLYDKELKKEFFQTDKFSGGELFTLHSFGNGAGEFDPVQQPDMEGFDQMRNYERSWQCVETGAVRDVFQSIQPLKETQAVLRFVFYKQLKRIDVEVELNRFNGENWREFRLAFPLNIKKAQVAYEVPMGVVEVGKDEMEGAAGLAYDYKPYKMYMNYATPSREVHPREVQDWFSASDGKTGLTISSDVAVFDWIDPTNTPVDYTILQPILLASRKSCNPWGNYYLQPGDHSYRFSIYTHSGDWRNNGYRHGTQTRQPLQTVITETAKHSGSLPESQSFLSVNGKGLMITTVKKCDDDDNLIIRCVEMEGKDTEATFNLWKPIKAAFHTNLIEDDAQAIPATDKGFSVKVGHRAIETFKVSD